MTETMPTSRPRPRYHVLDDLGRVVPVSIETWTRWYARNETRLKRTVVASRGKSAAIAVTTEFVGIDEALAGPPQVFKTVVSGGLHAGEVWTHSTYGEATAGHERVAEALRAGCGGIGR